MKMIWNRKEISGNEQRKKAMLFLRVQDKQPKQKPREKANGRHNPLDLG